jgi:TrmH RNA methyltransferase
MRSRQNTPQARQLRTDQTPQEQALWYHLRRGNVDGRRFRRQVPIGPWIVDFACLTARLVIEVDGSQHGDARDSRRDHGLELRGFRVMRFWNNEVDQRLDDVLESIFRAVSQGVPPPSPALPPSRGKGAERGAPMTTHDQNRSSKVGVAADVPIDLGPADGRGVPRGPARQSRDAELRLFGLNACRAVFERRPKDIRKAWLTERRVPDFKPMLAWLARERVGYTLVADDDLERLTQSQHHEGVCLEVLRRPPLALEAFLRGLKPGSASWLVLLDGVGNPHNFGAVLRIAAHFGADAVLLPPGSTLALNGAACRVAEGGAESVPLVATGDLAGALPALERAGYAALATVVRQGTDLYESELPRRALLVFGAEGGGLSAGLLKAVRRRVRIPGTGTVESLNIATAVGVVAAEFWRQHRRG